MQRVSFHLLTAMVLMGACGPGYPDTATTMTELEVMEYELREGEPSKHRLRLTADGDESTHVAQAELRVSVAATSCPTGKFSAELECRGFRENGKEFEVPIDGGSDVPKLIDPPGFVRTKFSGVPIPMTMTCDLSLYFHPELADAEPGCVEWGAEAWAEFTNGDLVLSLVRGVGGHKVRVYATGVADVSGSGGVRARLVR